MKKGASAQTPPRVVPIRAKHARTLPTLPYQTAPPHYGYYAQQEDYQEKDRAARTAAWDLHNNMADVPLGSATATITVSVSLDKSLPASVFGSVHTIGETNLGALYLTELGKLAFECAVPYSGTTSLQIESNGQGQVTVGGPITMSFVGEEGKARVTLLGLSVEGFTLEGELGGGIHSFLAAAGGFL